ncbi:MAG: hypothetical protein Q7J80_00935 [Anaerolineales bacterium]|nr:hypothetical protein [Anaerolineales bacterium]
MKLNVMFTIAAVYGIFLGLFELVAPAAASAGTLTDGLPGMLFMIVRFWGVAYIGLGLIAWFVRNAEPSKARDGVTLGLTIFFALHALTSLYGQFTDASMSTHWIMAIVQGLIAVGFFMAGRASMSASTS